MKPTDYLALAIGTFGVGYLPLMPGTFGSLVGVGMFLLLARANMPLVAVVVVLILAVTFAGIWAGSRIERLSDRKDPGKVVVDEVAGQLIALFPLTLFPQWSTGACPSTSSIGSATSHGRRPTPARRGRCPARCR